MCSQGWWKMEVLVFSLEVEHVTGLGVGVEIGVQAGVDLVGKEASRG